MPSRTLSHLGLTVAFILLWPNTLWANLAVFSTTDIQRTGNLVPIRKSRIELLTEKFTAKLAAETAVVTVNYEFVNRGGDDTVTVGFPVDLMPPTSIASYSLNNSQGGLQNLRILDGTSPVPIQRSVEETLRPQDRPKLPKDVAITRRWSIATIQFRAGERKNVRVSYLVRCMGVDEAIEGELPRKISPRTFLYSFRTASGWGTGRIRSLDISLDTSFLQENRFPLLSVEPKLKERGGGRLGVTFQNAELSRVADLTVRYNPKKALFHIYAQDYLLRRSNWRLGTCGVAKSGSGNLADGNPQTVWTPNIANGVGACIEITPRHESYLTAVAILNGNQASPSACANHARIKKLRIEYPFRLEEGVKQEVVEQTFPDEKFDDRAIRFPMAAAQFLELPSGPEGIIEKLKLTVLELYPGANGAPLAVSDLYVYGINGKK